MQPRGIRNNNPGNIRHGDKWLGLSDKQSDSSFCTFKTPVYGIRAMAKILLNYQMVYGLKTLAGIIHRWAPPNENDTCSYIDSVAEVLGVAPKEEIDVGNPIVMAKLIKAIIRHENGIQPYADDTIFRAMRLVGVK